ncbi:hypothetical protein NM688_g5252 [Phlebia brevispora]|uniref:Uncharacterized protein n=1 Tax=Phlebia brevispora TaxID=194682 RepID=A0ACC1SY93_9APHY|nr:hypothetical protein NM688_g5252 [Phlebia brevispora]
MNVTSSHPKLRTTLRFADLQFVAGNVVSGKMEMECKAEKGLAVGVIKVDLFGTEELTSRDHSATQTFLHAERIFQGPGLPPSNSVHPYPPAGEVILPHHYYYARRGITTFWFRLPLPSSSPSSINLGSGLAQIRYEVRATVEVIWKGQKQIVTDKKKVEVIESYDKGTERAHSEAIVVSENGKMWIQGKLLGGVIVPGQPACVELTVKNHSTKKNSSLAVSLNRELVLPNFPPTQKAPLQISDTLASVTFRGPEYIIQPGVEGVAHLVFDVPQTARSVRGGTRQSEEDDSNASVAALFEVRCFATVKLAMGIGSKNTQLELPARICHPDTIPEDVWAGSEAYPLEEPDAGGLMNEGYSPPFSPTPYMSSTSAAFLSSSSPAPYLSPASPPHPFIAPPISPTMSPLPYVDQGQVWIPSLAGPLYNPYSTPPPQIQQYQYIPQSVVPPPLYPVRPSSAQPTPSSPSYPRAYGLPPPSVPQPVVPLAWMSTQQTPERTPEREEGQGERAARVSHHLRISSRHRSVSPQAHRYALPAVDAPHTHADDVVTTPSRSKHERAPALQSIHTPSPPLSPNLSSNGEVVSPRPGFSPRHSFSVDPVTHVSLSKGDCVETLERIAAVTDEANADMSGSVPDLSPQLDKTLPIPPVPSSKTKPSSARPRADTIFQQPQDFDLDATPPTPTLAAVSSPKALRSAKGATGLDALEARLLAEVGTRKVDLNSKRPHVKSVLPITIPRPTDVIDLPVDSAISSLSLPSLGGANEGTLRLTGSRSNSPRSRQERSPSRELVPEREVSDRPSKPKTREGRSRKHLKADDPKEKEHHRLRKMAQGRVTAWLGSIDPEAPPQSATPPLQTPPSNNISLPGRSPAPKTKSHLYTPPSNGIPLPNQSLAPEIAPREVDSTEATKTADTAKTNMHDTPPNPRSSGFMPLGTIRNSRVAASPGASPGSPTSKNDEGARHRLPRGVRGPRRASNGGCSYVGFR